MATLMIRDLDDGTYARLRAHAEANGRSPEDEVRQMIDDRVKASRAAWVVELRAALEEQRSRYGVLPDSTPLIRQMRAEE